jgi:hypothetical protein
VYLRHSIVRKDGKKHVYWRLVRSVRRNGKVVQETVAQLGELDAEGRAKAKALARRITGRGEQRELFGASTAGDTTVPVRLDRIRLERGQSTFFMQRSIISSDRRRPAAVRPAGTVVG